MPIGKFFKHLFGGVPVSEMSDDPFGRRSQAVAATAHATAPSQPECLVRRDEILDARSRIAGYRFVVERVGSTLTPTFAETIAALVAENVAGFARRRLALLPMAAADCLRAPCRQLQAENTFFLVTSPTPEEDRAAWLQTLRRICEAGGRVAVDDASATDRDALELADLCLIDFRGYSLENFERLLRRLQNRGMPLPIAIDGLGAWAEHRLCIDRGATYSLGGFAATADADNHRDRLNQSRLVLIDMLNLLRRDAELGEIAAVAKRDPGIALKVVAMANAPIMGLSAPVASLDQAMMVLGRASLYRWLSVAMYRAGSSDGRDESMLEMALWRARFLELIASAEHPQSACDELFLVGLFSLLDSLLGIPIADIVKRMNLPPAVVEVLIESTGSYARYLLLALAVEKGGNAQTERLAAQLALPLAQLAAANRSAREWANEALDAG